MCFAGGDGADGLVYLEAFEGRGRDWKSLGPRVEQIGEVVDNVSWKLLYVGTY